MKKYINIVTGEYPLSEFDIRSMSKETAFPENFSAEGFAEVLETATIGITYLEKVVEGVPELQNDGTYLQKWIKSFKTEDLVETKLAVKQAIAQKRKEVEASGVIVGTSLIDSSIESQNRITSAKLFSDMNPTATIDFKGTEGWVVLTNAEITAIAQAIGTHVQHCFSIEKSHSELIDIAATLTEVTSYDYNIGWVI